MQGVAICVRSPMPQTAQGGSPEIVEDATDVDSVGTKHALSVRDNPRPPKGPTTTEEQGPTCAFPLDRGVGVCTLLLLDRDMELDCSNDGGDINLTAAASFALSCSKNARFFASIRLRS